MKIAKLGLAVLGLICSSPIFAANPDFSALSAVSDNANPTWAKAGDTITFTLDLTAAEDSDGSGFVTFSIGALGAQTATFPAAAASTSHQATYVVPALIDGEIQVTNLLFQNTTFEAIVNTPPFPALPSPNVTVDNTAPVFAGLTAVSNNADTTKAKAGDSVSFTLSLANNDTWNAGNTLQYTIGVGAPTALGSAFVSTSGTNTKLSGSRSVTINAGDTGDLSVTSLTFTDRAGNAITGFIPGAPVPNVTVDTTAPVITLTNDVDAGPTTSDVVTIAVTEVDPNLALLEYGFSADAVCDQTDVFGNPYVIGGDITFNTEGRNGEYLCVRAADNSGNTAYQISANPFNIDITAPTILSVTQSSTNANAGFARAGDTVTYSITYSEAVTVGPVHLPSSVNNASGIVTDVSALNNNQDTLQVTIQAGDNGLVSPVVNFDISDEAGNSTTINTLGVITGGSAVNTITADTTTPTLSSVTFASNNTLSSQWAKLADTLTLSFTGTETLTSVAATIATENAAVLNPALNQWTATLTTSGDEVEGAVPFTIDFSDEAGNVGTTVIATTDFSSVTYDQTAPTLGPVTIASNNALDTTLAKSNDTITVTFTVQDNLATSASLGGAATILNQAAVSGVTTVGANQTISRFTDGSENSEVQVPFSFTVQDEAGNVSALVSTTTDGSQVQFDRTNPLVSQVTLSATSVDGSADTRDVPTYYAKQGDSINFSFLVCDYVDSQNNPPTGTLFGTVGVVMTDGGLTGATCLTPEGNTVNLRQWTTQLTNIDGTEGTVTFDFTVADNAGNSLANVTGTTDASRIIFDKTAPSLPTDIVDLSGAATLGYKDHTDAVYSWTNDEDPNPNGADLVSGVYAFDITSFTNPAVPFATSQNNILAPTRSFNPQPIVPNSTDPYELAMTIRDKAGNTTASPGALYSQRYGLTLSGTVRDNDSGVPIVGAQVNVIARDGQTCQDSPNQNICSAATDNNGNYRLIIKAQQDYKVDIIKVPNYYLSKSDITIETSNAELNGFLAPVQQNQVQTGKQGTVITLDLPFTNALNQTETTYVTVFGYSGEATVSAVDDGFRVESFGTITSITSNNPALSITSEGNNRYLITTTAALLNITDNTNPASSVSSQFSSGANQVGIQTALGGASAGFQPGRKRSDRVVNQTGWTEQESRDFAEQYNAGTDFQVHQYRNRNGHMVFSGYQAGRMAIADMAGSEPARRLQKNVVYRGPKSRAAQAVVDTTSVSEQKQLVKARFKTDTAETRDQRLEVVENPRFPKAKRPDAETIFTELTYGNPKLNGFDRKTDVYAAVRNKKENDERYVNKFARVMPEATQAKSRLRRKSVDMIVFRGEGRGEKVEKLSLGHWLKAFPRPVKRREEVVQDQP